MAAFFARKAAGSVPVSASSAKTLTVPVATFVIWFAFYKLLRVPLPWGVLTKFAF